MELSCAYCTKFEVLIWPWPFDPKNIEVLIWSLSTHVWSIITLSWKGIALSCQNDANFKVQIWPWPVTFLPKIYRCLPPIMGNTCVNSEVSSLNVKRNGVIGNPFSTDSHGETSIPCPPPPPHLVDRGIITSQSMVAVVSLDRFTRYKKYSSHFPYQLMTITSQFNCCLLRYFH